MYPIPSVSNPPSLASFHHFILSHFALSSCWLAGGPEKGRIVSSLPPCPIYIFSLRGWGPPLSPSVSLAHSLSSPHRHPFPLSFCQDSTMSNRFLYLHTISFAHTLFIALIMEALHTYETSVYFNETTRLYIPEDCYLQQK
jgi:hypothetical protein